ncbi:MAG TPA: hypothetical protein VMS21_06690 [Methylomirabilota bacterium]|nr:hypothetical protein [Methylomirabilota bacterium]
MKTNLPHVTAPVLGLVLSTLAGAGSLPACDEPVWSAIVQNTSMNAIAVSPDDSLVASATRDGAIRFWNATNGQLAHSLRAPYSIVRSLAFSPDGTHLALAMLDGDFQLWRVSDGAVVHAMAGSQSPHSDLPVQY